MLETEFISRMSAEDTWVEVISDDSIFHHISSGDCFVSMDRFEIEGIQISFFWVDGSVFTKMFK